MISYPIIYTRWAAGESRIVRWSLPLPISHPLIGRECIACSRPFRYGAALAGIVIGGDQDRDGRWHAAPTLVVHDACLGLVPPSALPDLVAMARQERGCAPFEESHDAGAHAHPLEPLVTLHGSRVEHRDPDTGQVHFEWLER